MSFVRSTAFEGLARSYTAASCSLNCLFFCARSFHYYAETYKRFKRLSTAAFASVDSPLAAPHFSEDPLPCMFAHAHLTPSVLYPSLQDSFLSRIGLFFQHGLA